MWEHRPLGIIFPRRLEKREKQLWMMVRTWTVWIRIRMLFGTCGLKEGPVVAVGELSPREGDKNRATGRKVR
jgi:hypothetical protein